MSAWPSAKSTAYPHAFALQPHTHSHTHSRTHSHTRTRDVANQREDFAPKYRQFKAFVRLTLLLFVCLSCALRALISRFTDVHRRFFYWTKFPFSSDLNHFHIYFCFCIIIIIVTQLLVISPPDLEAYRNPRLESLPRSIGSLRSLEHLFLKSTAIRNFPKSFANLTGLEMLDLSGLNLTTLPNICRSHSVTWQ